ncbi:MAG TPA: 4a-hydroxytetrahydrobiopterin dehydratase [Longimicrobium sp.]|jgi:4a-hydroxytetrahydrobiopterin dehydratase|uniref:4a-hydroxytetrahydrobiopterin dehydratase n=1 Tax=Longimicrobium sp. TaxID=2029185 RepID=UPI002ED9A014
MTEPVPLAERACVPCRSGAPAVDGEERARWMAELPEWSLREVEGVPRLERVFRFPDFRRALSFTNAVGAVAEEADHHPALLTEWGRVTVGWWTHSIGGLHANDFVMAARTDRVFGTCR